MLRRFSHRIMLSLLVAGCRSPSSRGDSSYTVTLIIQNTSDDKLDAEFHSSTNGKVTFSIAPGQTETRSVSSKQEMEGADCNTSTGQLSISGKSGAMIGGAGYRVQELGCAEDMTAKAVCNSEKCDFEIGKGWTVTPVPTATPTPAAH